MIGNSLLLLATMRFRCNYLIFIGILMFDYSVAANEDLQRQILPTILWTELEGDATLPCNITMPIGDKINLILWFKDSAGIPIYSFDARGVDHLNGIHMAVSDLEKRCSFAASGSQRGSLTILKITKQDIGMYKCRIDFFDSPTQQSKVMLNIADVPAPPVIEQSHGFEVNEAVGPFREGESMDLKCSVNNGNPTPRISWWLDGEQIRGYTSESAGRVWSHLVAHSIPRSHNGKFLHCRANINGVSKIMLEDVVRLNVHVKPSAVSILNGNNAINDGESAKFVCNCYGSNPPATVSWLLDGQPIRSSAITVIHSNNTTNGTLTVRVDPTFNARGLFCRCENPEFPGFILEDKKALQVYYKPLVQVSTRPRYNLNRVKEGDNISLECLINSNPMATAVQWYHNGKPIESENKLVYNLRNVSLSFEGEYECEAFNREGLSRSEKLTINVLHVPFCQWGFERQSIIATVHETVILHCEVETGATNRHVQFSWTLNNTVKIGKVDSDQIQSAGKISILKYTPHEEEDFGDIACWAQNDVGPQKVPCYFQLTFGNKPSRPENCLTRSIDDSLKITCDPGFDGGLKQYFVLEIRLANTSNDEATNEVNEHMNDQGFDLQANKPGKSLHKMRKESPVFDIFSLESGLPYIFILYAVNLKGKSDPVILTQELKSSSKNTLSSEISAPQDTKTIPEIYIAIMALTLAIASLVIMTALILACRSRNVNGFPNVNELNNFRIGYSDVGQKRSSNYESQF